MTEYMVVINSEESDTPNLEIADYNLSYEDAKNLANEIEEKSTSFASTVRIVKHERF